MGERARVAVVGAGIAGLLAARKLRDHCDVVVFDKARGVGGRMATRRIGSATLDHGAQFLTTHTDRFASLVAEWEDAGVVAEWFSARVGPSGVADGPADAQDGHIRYRGVGTMNDIAKHLAEGTDVRTQSRVTSVRLHGGRWRLSLGDSEPGAEPRPDADSVDADAMDADEVDADEVDAAAVLLTAPVPQTLAMLEAGSVQLAASDVEALDAIRYDPCLAVLVPLNGPSGLPEPGAVAPGVGPIDWMADNQAKGVSTTPAVTIHASAAESRRLWDADDRTIVRSLVRAAGLASAAATDSAHLQRWRFARPVVGHPDRCLALRDVPPLVVAGDAFGEPRAEGAALSGLAAAEVIAGVTGCGGPD